jgi:type II secretory pathway pseudopilin PulG
MSVLGIVIIVVAVLAVLLFVGGLFAVRRRSERQDFSGDVARADQALEQARAADRGWNRQLMDDAARRALGSERPGFDWHTLELVLVEDRPGIEEDRAHVVAVASAERVRVVLAREPDGTWIAESIG